MNRELEQYIERTVIPRYEGFDRAHGTEHVRTVIARSLALARHYDVSSEMVYAVAAYHDTAFYSDLENGVNSITRSSSPLRSRNIRKKFTISSSMSFTVSI